MKLHVFVYLDFWNLKDFKNQASKDFKNQTSSGNFFNQIWQVQPPHLQMMEEQRAGLRLTALIGMKAVEGDGEGGAAVTLEMEGIAAVNAIVVEGMIDAAMMWV